MSLTHLSLISERDYPLTFWCNIYSKSNNKRIQGGFIMVVSFDAFVFLTIIQIIVCIVYFPFISFRRSETWNKILQLCLSSTLLLTSLFRIPMEVQFNKSYDLSIFSVIGWFIIALFLAFYLGRSSRH